MPIATLPAEPDAATLRRLAYSTTIRPTARVPWEPGCGRVLANAAGWAPGMDAAAILAVPHTTGSGVRVMRAELIVATGKGTRASPASWASAVLAEWPRPAEVG